MVRWHHGVCSVAIASAAAAYIALHGQAAARLDVLQMLDSAAAAVLANPPSPRLSHALESSQFWLAGGQWLVQWNASASLVSVSRPDDHGALAQLWATRSGLPFIAAAKSESAAAESHGNFQIRERVLWQCVEQRVESISAPSAETVLLRGTFEDRGPCEGATWTLQLGVSVTAAHLEFDIEISSVVETINRAQLAYDLGANTRAVWGLGIQYQHFNLRGHCVPAFVSEQGVGRGAPGTKTLSWLLDTFGGGAGGNEYTTYASSASILTSAGSGLALYNSELSYWDLGSGGCNSAHDPGYTSFRAAWRRSLLWGGRHIGSSGAGPETLAVTVHARRFMGRIITPARCAKCVADEATAGHGFVAQSQVPATCTPSTANLLQLSCSA